MIPHSLKTRGLLISHSRQIATSLRIIAFLAIVFLCHSASGQTIANQLINLNLRINRNVTSKTPTDKVRNDSLGANMLAMSSFSKNIYDSLHRGDSSIFVTHHYADSVYASKTFTNLTYVKYSDTSSMIASKWWVGNNYVPQIRTLTFLGTTYTFASNMTLQTPTFNQVTTADSSSNNKITINTTIPSSGTPFKTAIGSVAGRGTYDNVLPFLCTYGTDTMFKFSTNGIHGYPEIIVGGVGFSSNYTRLHFGLTGGTISFPDATGTIALRDNLTTGTITGNGILTSFTIVAPSAGTVVVACSASSGATVQSATISGTTITIKTTAAPAIGTYTIAYWYK